MRGGGAPFTLSYGPASGTARGIVTTSAQTFAGVKTFTDGIAIGSTATPTLTFTATTTTICTEVASSATDSGTNPIMAYNARIGASTTATTRPTHAFQNNGTTVLSLIPINSGANSALTWGTQARATPTFTNRSNGTRAVWYSEIDGTHTDFATGAGSGTLWHSVPQATTSYGHWWFGGTTSLMTLRGDGRLETTGARIQKLRVATTTPVTVAAGTDHIICTNLATPGAVAVNLPATPATGLTYVIKDDKGDAAANNITITPAAGNIDGVGTLVLNANYAQARLVYNGTQWNRIGS